MPNNIMNSFIVNNPRCRMACAQTKNTEALHFGKNDTTEVQTCLTT